MILHQADSRAPVAHPSEGNQATATPARHGALVDIAAAAFVLALLARVLSQLNVLDLDVFHEMALFREALRLGQLPRDELFAFTPIVHPSVHHEWASGMVLYGVAVGTGWGAAGLLALKYLLTAVIIGLIGWHARQQLSGRLALVLAPVAILLGQVSFVTLRAQLFTLTLSTALLLLLERHRRGARWWLLPWMALHVIWLNLHGGFVVGLGLLGLYWLEQLLRHRTLQWHLILSGIAMAALVLVNPYGLDYPRFLWHALTMPRPMIHEWRPIFQDPPVLGAYLASLLVLTYAVWRRGWRNTCGLLILVVLAVLAFRHVRHASLYAVAWIILVPPWLRMTPLNDLLVKMWARHQAIAVSGSSLIVVAVALTTDLRRLWQVDIPTTQRAQGGVPIYPAGAVDYLEAHNFQGNLMTPFNAGSYVMWHLYPAVKVGLDSRYEVAYQPGIAERITAMYQGAACWQETLQRYPSDAILVPVDSDLADLLAAQDSWQQVYRDDAYLVFMPQDRSQRIPHADRRGQAIVGRFP